MIHRNKTILIGTTLLALTIQGGVDGLQTSNSKRPIVSLTGTGDVSGFLYGKLQRATSIYGSGLVGPATAIVHGDKDLKELLPPSISKIASPQKQLKDLDTMLWNQFGMATCEGSVEREDLLTPMSYLKPKLCDLRDTLVFLDATTTAKGGSNGSGGLGGLFSSMMGRKPNPNQKPQNSRDIGSKETYWLDLDLIRSAVTRGSGVFVVCESQDTEDCAIALADCLDSLGEDANKNIVTLVSPDENVKLGGTDEDSTWNSLRPQDLEGELSKTISVRDGTDDCFPQPNESIPADEEADEEEETPTFKRTREERLAAAYAEDPEPKAQDENPSNDPGSEARMAAAENFKPPSTISLHDLAEVCVQCALRLPTTNENNSAVRVVRVTAMDEGSESDSTGTDRPNSDYFTLTGGPKAKAKAGVVSSVDWTKTLSCFANANGSVGVKEFPKRPDVV